MDETREPLLMLSIAFAVAVYKALRYVQAGEAVTFDRCKDLEAKNGRLIEEVRRLRAEVDDLHEAWTDDPADREPSPAAGWDPGEPPW